MMKPRSDWSITASYLARNTYNPIRTIVETLKPEPNPHKPLIALSIGDPTIYGNLSPAPEIIDAVVESVQSMKFNGYAPSTGYESARAAVANHVSLPTAPVKPEDVVLCSGCSCALDLCISVLADAGQNILIPRPGFLLYRTLAEGLGIQTKSYNLLPEKGWEIDLEHLESQIDSKTVAVVINNPSNPCGSVFSRKHLQDIVALAAKYYLPIIADEIYDYFTFEGHEFIPIASLSTDVPVLQCGGLTKRYLVPGWRMGWIVIHDRNNAFAPEIRKGLQNLSQRIIGSTTLVQGALPTILSQTPKEFFESTIAIVQGNALLAYSMLSKVPGLNPVLPTGAMYMMIGIDIQNFLGIKDESEFVQKLVNEQSVFCLPGSCFDYPNYMRIVLTLPEEQVREACIRIAEFCEIHYCRKGLINGHGELHSLNNTLDFQAPLIHNGVKVEP